MRSYSQVAPQFWIGETGRRIRGDADAQRVALYLITCPSANMIGLYYLSIPTLCHEVGISKEGASKALQSLAGLDFCHYDPLEEMVFIPQMAFFQLGEKIKPKDNRHKHLVGEIEKYRKCSFYNRFMKIYGRRYCLPKLDGETEKPEAPLKALQRVEGSHGEEQEQEQEHNTPFAAQTAISLNGVLPGFPDVSTKPRRSKSESNPNPSDSSQLADFWKRRYSETHNGSTIDLPPAFRNTVMADLLARVQKSLPRAQKVIEAYLTSREPFYEGHPLNLFKRDLDKFIVRADAAEKGAPINGNGHGYNGARRNGRNNGEYPNSFPVPTGQRLGGDAPVEATG
jgi:hypothetical protein